jgi:hypothetical protein
LFNDKRHHAFLSTAAKAFFIKAFKQHWTPDVDKSEIINQHLIHAIAILAKAMEWKSGRPNT